MSTMTEAHRVGSPLPAPPPAWGLWGRLSWWIVRTPWVAWTLVAINLGAAIPGYLYWYGDDILQAPVYLWPFVPDSPLSVTLMGAALIVLHRRGRADLLGLLACTGAIKYGAWTVFVWFLGWLQGTPYTFEAAHLSLSHFGMVLEGLVLVPLLAPRLIQVAAVLAWYWANDVVDYVLGFHPRVPHPEDLGLIAAFAVTTTAILSLAWVLLWSRSWLRTPRDRRGP
jgi:uncharacterized membrane protein YpjA